MCTPNKCRDKCKYNCTRGTILPNQFSSVTTLISCINGHIWPTVDCHSSFLTIHQSCPAHIEEFTGALTRTPANVAHKGLFLLSPTGTPEVMAKYETLIVYPVLFI